MVPNGQDTKDLLQPAAAEGAPGTRAVCQKLLSRSVDHCVETTARWTITLERLGCQEEADWGKAGEAG